MATKKGAELEEIMAGIELAVGNKKKSRLTLGNEMPDADIVSFGIPSVDAASNAGGHPRGAIIEIFGPESSGKSYTCYKTIAAYQARGLKAMLLDVENAYWEEWIAKAGVDTSKLVVGSDFESGEQALMYAEKAAESKAFGVIVVDSVAALLPQSEADSSLDHNARVGAHAAMMSRCLRKLQGVMAATNTTLIFTNQTRNKIGVMFGNPEETPGGKALKFYAGMRIGLQFVARETAKIDGVDKPVGIRTKCRFIKNKIGQPFGEDELVIYSVEGINTPMVQLVNLALRLKVIPGKKAFDDDKDKKTFYWKGDDGEVENTGCRVASELSEWLEANELVAKVASLVIEKGKARNIDVPEEVAALAVDTKQNAVDSTGVVDV